MVYLKAGSRKHTEHGFTLIEVIIALAILCIFSVCIAGMDAQATMLFKRSDMHDEAYCIAMSICEKFRSENEDIQNGRVLLYVDSPDEIAQSISDIVRFGICADGMSFDEWKAANCEHKKFIVAISCSRQEFTDTLEAAVYPAQSMVPANGASIRIGRVAHAD